VKYESLVADPRGTLEPVLNGVGIPFSDACLRGLETKHVPSLKQSALPAGSEQAARSIPQLVEQMTELDYDIPRDSSGSVTPATARAEEIVTRIGLNTWRLNGPFRPEGSFGWMIDLSCSPFLAVIEGGADTYYDTTRSRVRLSENGQRLGPPHSLHAHIREQGNGLYSHWAPPHYMLFSTSDNSDPNTNGKTYTITLQD
jgi:hypothetical protein